MDIRFLMEQGYFRPDEIPSRYSDDNQQYLKEGKISKQGLLWMLLNKKCLFHQFHGDFIQVQKSEISITHSKQREIPYPSDLVTSEFLRQDHYLNTSRKVVSLRIPKQIQYGFSFTFADSCCQLGNCFSKITQLHDSNVKEVLLSCCSLDNCLPDCSQVFTDISTL